MDDYVCLTVRSNTGELEDAFRGRLTAFWTHMVRNKPDDYEKVYAEATKFEPEGDTLTRQYMIESGVVEILTGELATAKIAFEPVDESELYSKYEATPPDWFWLEH
jgi:hypothetical protein